MNFSNCQGNFHALLLFKDTTEFEVVKAAVHRMVERAQALEGTCKSNVIESQSLYFFCTQISSGTGEHGVGIGKKEYLETELGQGTVQVMKEIKRTIDPLNIMNPGKVN
jgi:D-lactate dehydrogenase (cytochrome)